MMQDAWRNYKRGMMELVQPSELQPSTIVHDVHSDSFDTDSESEQNSICSTIDLDPAAPNIMETFSDATFRNAHERHRLLQQRLLQLPEQQGFLEIKPSRAHRLAGRTWWACTQTSKISHASSLPKSKDATLDEHLTCILTFSAMEFGEAIERLELVDLQALQMKSQRSFVLMDGAGDQFVCQAPSEAEGVDWVAGKQCNTYPPPSPPLGQLICNHAFILLLLLLFLS